MWFFKDCSCYLLRFLRFSDSFWVFLAILTTPNAETNLSNKKSKEYFVSLEQTPLFPLRNKFQPLFPLYPEVRKFTWVLYVNYVNKQEVLQKLMSFCWVTAAATLNWNRSVFFFRTTGLKLWLNLDRTELLLWLLALFFFRISD